MSKQAKVIEEAEKYQKERDEIMNDNENLHNQVEQIKSEYNLKERKQQFESLEKEDRKIVTIFGEINFKRRYYLDKNNAQRVYLLDEYFKIVGKETKENEKEKSEYKRRIYRSFYALDFKQTKEIVYEILAEEMEETTRRRKERLLQYILNNKEGIRNLYKHQKELHGCSAERHVSHLYSARLSSRPLGWKTVNVDNVSRLD